MKWSSKYIPGDFEKEIYDLWEKNKAFSSLDESDKEAYSILLPPPNVTGFLHLGHALDQSIQDTLIRFHRMKGKNVSWIPGVDHAGIATQIVVEKNLKKKGVLRKNLSREEFLKEVWSWKEEYGDRILSQMKKLGNSCDWDRYTFTLDPEVSKAVRFVFCQLYQKGLIYRGEKLIYYSTALESALSDLEVEHREVKSFMYYVKYSLTDSKDQLIIGTTRPETILADTAICVHPEDKRYQKYIGKKVRVPLTNRQIPIISDSYVDPEFGTGVLKITPAHDFNDYEIGKKHNLPIINLLNENGLLNKNAKAYSGLKVSEARKKITEDLKQESFLEEVKDHKHSVAYCSRSNQVAEPFLSSQWFVKMKDLAKPASLAVKNKKTSFTPKLWEKTYLHWLDKIEDWCISRQLWWGHQIPCWHCQDCSHLNVSLKTCEKCEKCESKNLKQDEDVLDTWFSSALWPFSTLGWPENTKALKTFYPQNVLVTGHDIIFFWLARMMMMGIEFLEKEAFKDVYIHGLIRDSSGRKMSKSLGNSVDPVSLIEEKGADCLRFSLLSQVALGSDIKFSSERLEGYRNFMNKIWNASSFFFSFIDKINYKKQYQELSDLKKYQTSSQKTYLDFVNIRILFQLEQTSKQVNKSLEDYQFLEACKSIYQFVWHEFCDWYLESIKKTLYSNDQKSKEKTLGVLAYVLENILKLIHPFCPFISEKIYQSFPFKKNLIMLENYPLLNVHEDERQTNDQLGEVYEIIKALRNIRSENRIKPSHSLKCVYIESKKIKSFETFICDMIRAEKIIFDQPKTFSMSAVCLVKDVRMSLPLEGLVDIKEEKERLSKKIKKTEAEKQKIEMKLNSQSFSQKAPKEIVDQVKEDLKRLEKQIQELQEHSKRLS